MLMSTCSAEPEWQACPFPFLHLHALTGVLGAAASVAAWAHIIATA